MSIRDAATYLTIAVVVAVICWMRARHTYGPMVLPDELGPLEYARFLVGENRHARLQYYPGSGFLLLPAVLIGDGALDEYRLALGTQSILLGLHAVLIAMIFRKLAPSRPRVEALVGGLTVGVLGGTVVASVLIWSETAVLLATSAVALGVVTAVQRGSRRFAAAVAAGAGLSIVIHPRLVVVAAAACLALCLSDWRRIAGRRSPFLAIIAATVLGAVAGRSIVWMLQRQAGSQSYAITPGDAPVFDRLFSFAMVLTGQVVIGTIATVGLVWYAVPRLRRDPDAPDTDALRVFVIVSLVGFAMLTALRFKPPIHRADIFYYSRYASPVYPLAIIAALQGREWYRGNRRALARRSLLAVVVVAVFGLYQIWRISPAEQAQSFIEAMSPELSWLVERAGRIVPVAVVGLALGAIGIAAAILGARARLAVGAALVSVVLFALAAQTRPGHMESALTSERASVIADELASVPVRECVAFDLTGSSQWYRQLYEFYLPNDVVVAHLPDGRRCGDMVISARNLRKEIPGSVLIRREAWGRFGLYQLPDTG